MIEKLVIFALGALGAGLIALFLGPIFARRAARLAARRVRAMAPLTMSEIQAQKDFLRAQYAVHVRKAEIRLERAERQMAKVQILAQEREEAARSAAAELARREAELGRLEAEVETLRAGNQELDETLAALNARYEEAAAVAELVEQRMAELEEARSVIDSQKVELVALRTQLDNLRDELAEQSTTADERSAEVDALRAELAAKSLQADDRAAQIDELSDALTAMQEEIAWRDGRLARRRRIAVARRRQVEALNEEIAAARAELSSRTLSLEAALSKADEQQQAVARLEEDRAGLAAAIEELRDRLEQRERELEALQAEVDELRLGRPDEGLSPQAAQLRESIGELAARIVIRSAATGDDEIRKLIDAVSTDAGAARVNGSTNVPLAERIKQADLQPGE